LKCPNFITDFQTKLCCIASYAVLQKIVGKFLPFIKKRRKKMQLKSYFNIKAFAMEKFVAADL